MKINEKNINSIILNLKKNKKKIGLVHGVFDVLHVGHMSYFEEAKNNVDFLIASVTSDKFASKAPGKPLFKTNNRIKVLRSIKFIDFVLESDSSTAEKIINKIKPDIYFKGMDYKKDKDISGNLKKEVIALKKINGKFYTTKTKIFSSSKIINQEFDFLNKSAQIFLDAYKKNNIRDKVDNISNDKNILVLGDPILDVYKMVSPTGKSNKANVLSTRMIGEKLYAGGSLLVANIVKNFSKNVTYLYCSNKENDFYIKKLLNSKINKVKIKSNVNFIKKTRYIDDYYSSKIFQVTNNEELEINETNKRTILKYLINNFKKFDKIFVFDFGYFSVFNEMLNFFNNNKFLQKKLIVNCQSNAYNFGFNLPNKFKYGEIIGMDEIEFRLCCGDKKTELNKLIKSNINIFKNFKILIVTQGKTGCFIVMKKKITYVPTIFKTAEDTTGCGDVFLTLFALSSISKDLNEIESALIAHIAAGLHANLQGNENVITAQNVISTVKNIIK